MWQLQSPIDAIVFDCDGTLCMIEGIDELAKFNGVEQEVAHLTQLAMEVTGLNANLYQKRLQLILPTQEQVLYLSQLYIKHLVFDAIRVINIFKRIKKNIFILSAGLKQAIALLGQHLDIPKSHIYAVDIQFDKAGHYCHFDRLSPLINHDGKSHIITELQKTHQNIVLIGDGLNDYAAAHLVKRFIGYGGQYFRKKLMALSPFYIKIKSFTPLLPLILTNDEIKNLTIEEQDLYQQGLYYIASEQVKVSSS